MKICKILFLFFGILTTVQKTSQEDMEVISSNLTSSSIHPSPAVNRTFMIICLLTIPPICIVGQLMLIYIIYIKKRKKYTSSFFTFLLLLIIAALYWLILLIFEGICLLLDRCPGGDLFNILITSNALFFYDMCMWSTLFISFNRFSAIFFLHSYERIFSKRMTKIYVAVVIVGSGIVNCPNWIYRLKYSTELATWTYVNVPSDYIIELLKLEEIVFAYTIHAAVFILYLMAFIRYRQRATRSVALKKEFRLMIQGTLGSVACFFFLTFHHVWHVPTVEFLAVLFCIGSDPFVYIGFNTDIRKDFKEIIKGTTNSVAIRGNGLSVFPIPNTSSVNRVVINVNDVAGR